MSQIRIFFNPLDASSVEHYDIEPGTALIDWLQQHYPVGFDGYLRVFVGGTELELENLDYQVKEAERITMLVMPAAEVGAWLAANAAKLLIQAAISAAIGFVISLIFRPSTPRIGEQGEESPVYSINATQNRARLNEPIAVHYGTVSYPPDYAAAPYVFYTETSNNMFVDELLCLGHGKFTINEIFVGETPVSALEPGAFEYWLFDETEHLKTIGTIESSIWTEIENGPNPIPFIENMFTSPEVEQWEFNEDVDETPGAPIAISGDVVAAVGGSLGRIEGVSSSLDIGALTTITLAGTTSNNVTLTVGSVVIDPVTPSEMTIYEHIVHSYGVLTDETSMSGTYTVDANVDNMVAGPYRAQKDGQQIDEIYCDILFPQGLMTVEQDGDQRFREITMQFTYQQIDETTGAPIGGSTVQTKTYRYKTRRPVRDTHSSGPLTPGAYEVTVERLTAFAFRGLSPETTVWAGLKGRVVKDTTKEVYGPVTMMAVRMKATNGLGQAARSRIRVQATRDIDGIQSTNPISIVKDIYTNTDYGIGRDSAELNLAELGSLESAWTTGPFFNGSFDQRGTGWEGMESVVSLAGAKVIQNNALVTVIPDRVQEVRTALFNTANIVEDSLEINYTFDTEGEFDGVLVEYRDPETFNPLQATYPEGATQPETFVLFGCTNATYALQFATYLWNVRFTRRRAVKFQTELEGLIPRFGDRIGVSHALPDWGESGVFIEQIDTLTWRVDRFLNWETDNNIILRDEHGKPSEMIPVTMGDNTDIVVFSETPPVTVAAAGTRDPTVYSFGRDYSMIKDFMVTKITPEGDTRVTVEGQLYDDSIYDGAPPHMGGFTPVEEEMIQIQAITDPVNGEFNWTNIPQIYRRLILRGKLSSTHVGDLSGAHIEVNGDTDSANYWRQHQEVSGGTPNDSAATSNIGLIATGTTSASDFSDVVLEIEGYTETAIKNIRCKSTILRSTTNAIVSNRGIFPTAETGPITSLKLVNSDGANLTGTLVLYGEN